MSQFTHQRIFIIGHPGAGKALLAKTLAEKLGWQFIDADFGLEFRIGRIITEVLGKPGEKSFHKTQADLLESLIKKQHIIVTTDASIVCSEQNRQLLSTEYVVNLQVSTHVQLERHSRQPMPLLLKTSLKSFLEKLHQERDHLYNQIASITINSDDSALEEHVMRIFNAIVINKKLTTATEPLTLDKKDTVFFHKTKHTPVYLSDQQARCLKLLAQGKSSKDIARELNISYRTVEEYISNIMELLGCSSSKELIALYHYHP